MREKISQLWSLYSTSRPGHRVLILLVVLVAILLLANANNGISETMSSIQATIISISAAGGLIVALEGLDTWHKQIRGRSDYDLAMKLGKDVINIRDLLCTAGLPCLDSPRLPNGARTNQSEDQQESISLIASWKSPKYMRKISASVAKLMEDRKEAEVLWGEEVHDVVLPLEDLGHELSDYADYLLSKENPKMDSRYVAILDLTYGKKRNPIAGLGPPHDNEYQKEVRSEARKVREYLAKFLG